MTTSHPFSNAVKVRIPLVTLIDEELVSAVADAGFAHAAATQIQAFVGSDNEDWHAFAASWNDLGEDRYMADGGRYRRRRHSCLCLAEGELTLLPPRPHYQSRDHNILNGGIERWFEPVSQQVLDGLVFHRLIALAAAIFPLRESSHLIEVHQFRIEARTDRPGLPTPEGMHRDGVDFVLVMLVARENVREGVTQLLVDDFAGTSFILSDPMEAVFLDDRRCEHEVTPIVALDPSMAAHRDVLVVTFAAHYNCTPKSAL